MKVSVAGWSGRLILLSIQERRSDGGVHGQPVVVASQPRPALTAF